MLAVKFHHLRALMYRPYLCFPLFKGPTIDTIGDGVDQLKHYRAVCVSEAQKMARLLHHVLEEADLVHEFPWWQIISCFVCAGSILIVANACTRDGDYDGFDRDAIDCDAEMCLKAFDALSCNSQGAKIAKDMMHKLRTQGARTFNPTAVATSRSQNIVPDKSPVAPEPLDPSAAPFPTSSIGDLDTATIPLPDTLFFDLDPYLQQPNGWPWEINDSMVWSAQFFDRVQGPEEPDEGSISQ